MLARGVRFTEHQIVAILHEAEAGVAVKDLCRKYGISSSTDYQSKLKDGGLAVSDIKRLRELESELAQRYACIERYKRTVRYDWLAQCIFVSITEVRDFATE